MVPSRFSWFFMVPGWFFMVFLQYVPAQTVSWPDDPIQVRRPEGGIGPSGDNENGDVADDADKDGHDEGGDYDDDKDDAFHSERTLVGHCVTLEETSPTPLLFPTNCHSWIHPHCF